MIRFLFSFLLTTAVTCGLYAQAVNGVLQDASDKTPVGNATIRLTAANNASTEFIAVSDNKGMFTINNVPAGNYTLTITSVSYSTLVKAVSVSGNSYALGVFYITKKTETLKTVVVDAKEPPVKQNGDTLDYAASQYKVNPDATAEDLIKKMPGITVDKSGTVTAHGETVQKVTLDGKDYFGDDATATLRNLPSDIIDKIQVFDRLSDQAQLTGFDDGNTTKSINIVTKANMRNGQFGRLFAGYGTDDRYSAGGNISFFNHDRRISLVGLFNNTNQQNFSSQDLLGITSSGNRGGGGQRGGGGTGGYRGGNGGNTSNFLVGQQNGISKTNAFGINYSDSWSKKIDVAASYFFNNSNTGNNETINQENFITADSIQYYNENTLSDVINYNNRASARITYKIDSANSILFTSSLNYQNTNTNNNVTGQQYINPQNILSNTFNDITTKGQGYNNSNNLLYRHAFHKRGRSISVGIAYSATKNDSKNYLSALNTYYKSAFTQIDTVQQLSTPQTNGDKYSVNFVYTEPLGKKSQLQLNYNPAFQNNHADQETFNYDYAGAKYSSLDTSLSNKFDNTYNTQNTGATYRVGDKNNNLSLGLSYQYGELKSNEIFPATGNIDRTFSNLLGNAFARFKFSAKSTLRIIYRSSVSPPAISQLQNVINNSNQFFYSTGNPDLKQSYTNNLITRYAYTNSLKETSFFANLFLQTTNDYVANATYTATRDSALTHSIILFKGSQISKPVNLNGYMSGRSFFTFGMPLKFIKTNLNWNAGFSYTRLPGLVNNLLNVSNTYNYNLGAVLASNISEYIDFTLSYAANINNITNTIQPSLNSNYLSQNAEFVINLLTKKGSYFQNDLSNESYSGLSSGFNQSYWLWNIAIGQKFLKNQAGDLKLSVFDLLKQNKSITRTVTASYIEDDRNEVFQQYFMLTFTYKLKNFGKASQRSRDARDDMRDPMIGPRMNEGQPPAGRSPRN